MRYFKKAIEKCNEQKKTAQFTEISAYSQWRVIQLQNDIDDIYISYMKDKLPGIFDNYVIYEFYCSMAFLPMGYMKTEKYSAMARKIAKRTGYDFEACSDRATVLKDRFEDYIFEKKPGFGFVWAEARVVPRAQAIHAWVEVDFYWIDDNCKETKKINRIYDPWLKLDAHQKGEFLTDELK
jgi:hypothetical protein